MTRLVISALVTCALGCDGVQDAGWRFVFADDDVRARAVAVEVRVVEGGCAGASTVFREDVIEPRGGMPPELPAGVYGLWGRATDGECRAIAIGCREVTFPLEEETTIEITLGTACHAARLCEVDACGSGVCAAPPSDPLSDLDLDGLRDGEEVALGLSPHIADTDGDTASDDAELGDDPEHPLDTDGDGVIDALDGDSDGGGECDRDEYLSGHDPLDPSDDVVGQLLTVTVADDEADGPSMLTTVADAGGPDDLSLREAMLIANHRPGADRITFAPSVTAIVLAPSSPLPSITDAGTVIEATTPVVIDGGGDLGVIGVAFTVAADDVRLGNLRLARFHTSGSCIRAASVANLVVERMDLTECKACADRCHHLVGATDVTGLTIVDSLFAAGLRGIELSEVADVVIERNRFTSNGDFAMSGSGATNLRFADNVVTGVGTDGVNLDLLSNAVFRRNEIVDSGRHGLSLSNVDGLIEENTITDNGQVGVLTRTDRVLMILGNVITRNGQGISVAVGAPAAPVLTGFDGLTVTGTSTLPDGGTIEVFVDPAGQGAILVGRGEIRTGAFSVPVTIPDGTDGFYLTATASHPTVGTSSFSDRRALTD